MKPVLLLPAIALLSACGGQPTAQSRAPLPVEVVPVRGGVAQAGATYGAIIAYDRETVLSPRVAGVVQAMPAQIGAHLRRGALVAALADAPYRAALARAEADAARLDRADRRNGTLLAAGAVAAADVQDNATASTAARAARAAAAYDLASTRVTMPFDGVVLTRSVDRGATLAPGQAVATVADLGSPLTARVQVPAALAATLRQGAAAVVLAPAGAIAAHVLRVGAASDPHAGTVEVDLVLVGGAGVASGMAVSVRFPAGGDGGVHIPAEALVDSRDGRGHVYLLDRGRARLTAIGVLAIDDDDVRVAGLPAGAQVITTGAGFVADGQAVAVLGR
jgi:membrane fusion protein, multidrug efflux system